ncbi:MAG: hypothetical protein WC052_02585 [Patescibacteria group bacterium]|jgi:hypothetical protein
MGLFDQMKMAKELMANMSPQEIERLTSQASTMKEALQEQIEAAVAAEISKRQLITRQEVEQMLNAIREN